MTVQEFLKGLTDVCYTVKVTQGIEQNPLHYFIRVDYSPHGAAGREWEITRKRSFLPLSDAAPLIDPEIWVSTHLEEMDRIIRLVVSQGAHL